MRHLLMVIVSAIYLLFGNSTLIYGQFSEAGIQKLKIPVDAPDFTLRELNGGMISSKELRGKIVIVNFFTLS